eukprot:Sspe_Gene.72851::Locus_43655_Transcript_1_1_Confidence_1.000_Length_501::g.72851::m.72851
MRSCNVLLLVVWVGFVSAGPTCQQLGFGDDLVCTTCDRMQKKVADPELVAECRKCCLDVGGAATVFDRAVLEMDKRQAQWIPELGVFVKQHLSAFPKLKVKYIHGRQPTVVLYATGKDGKEESDSVLVSTWKADQIVEYLNAKLKK